MQVTKESAVKVLLWLAAGYAVYWYLKNRSPLAPTQTLDTPTEEMLTISETEMAQFAQALKPL